MILTKSSSEIFNNKVSLIYEYDKHSPLFVKTANTEMEHNNIEKAINILNSGIKEYPQYSTAYLVLGKAYALFGNYDLALKNIRKGSDLIHSKKTYDFYVKELENIKKQRSLFENNNRNIFITDNGETESNEEPDMFLEENKEAEIEHLSVDDRLDEIAKEISSAKIPKADSNTTPDDNFLTNISSKSMIVSETLAKIYVAQGELKEAIEVYNKLIDKEPGKKEYFLQQINELKSKLGS